MNQRHFSTRDLIRFANFELDIPGRKLRQDGKLRWVEPRTFELLVHLIRQAPRVVSKDELLNRVWASRHVTGSVVAQGIMKLRKVLGQTSDAPGLIRTVHTIGYRFDGIALPGTEAPCPARADEAALLQVQLTMCPETTGTTLQPLCATTVAALWSQVLRPAFVAFHVDRLPAVVRTAEVAVRLRGTPGRWMASARLLLSDGEASASARGRTVGEVLVALARDVGLLLRMRHPQPTAERADTGSWRHLDKLLHLADPWSVEGPIPLAPALAETLARDSLHRRVDLVMALAQRADPLTPALTTPQRTDDTAGQFPTTWGRWCQAAYFIYSGQRERAVTSVANAPVLPPVNPACAPSRRLALLMAQVLGATGRPEEGLLLCRQTVSTAPTEVAVEALIDRQTTLALLHGDAAQETAAVSIASHIAPVHVAVLPASAERLVARAQCAAASAGPGPAQDWLRAAVRRADEDGQASAQVLAHLHLGLMQARVGDSAALADTLVNLGHPHRRHAPQGELAHRWLRARQFQLLGDWRACASQMDAVVAVFEDVAPWWNVQAWLFLGGMWRHLGERERLVALRERLGTGGATGVSGFSPLPSAMDALLCLLDRDLAGARQALKAAWALGREGIAGPTLGLALASLMPSRQTWPTHLRQAWPRLEVWLDQTAAGQQWRQRDKPRALAAPTPATAVSGDTPDAPDADPSPLCWIV